MRFRSARDRRRWGVVGLVAAVLAGGVAVAAQGEGFEDSRVSLADGGAWLASPQRGLVTLINGPAEQVVGYVPAPGAQSGDALSVVQSRASAYIVNGSQGTVARVDGATYETSAPVQFGEAGSPLSVYAGGQALYVVDSQRRTASVTDPVSLRVREPLSLAAQPGPDQSVVDATGRLWVIDRQLGGLTWFDPEKQVRPDGADPSARLVLVQGRPVLVDLDRARLGALSDAGEVEGWSCLDVRPGDQVQLLGSQSSDRVFAQAAGTGTLVAGAVGRDGCELSVSVGRASDELGSLVESGRFVFVPNRTSGRTVVVDADAGRVVADLPVVRPGARLELLAEDGFVFYHNVDGPEAGVITFEGGRWQVGRSLQKYDESDTGIGILTPGDGEEPPGGEDASGDEDPPAGEDPPGGEDPPDGGENPPGGEDPPDGGENPPGGEDPPGENPPGGGEGPPGGEIPPGDDPPGGGDPAAVVLTASRQGTAGTLTATVAGGPTEPCDPMCSVEVDPGTSVTLQAAAAAGSEISHWTGVDGCAQDATCTVTMNADSTVAVVFAERLVELTVTVGGDGGGTVTGDGIGIDCPTTCTTTVGHGTQITLTANPTGDDEFTGWGGACSGAATTCDVRMDGDRTVSATFAERVDLVDLSVDVSGPGRVTGGPIDCGQTCFAFVERGEQVTLSAQPDSGFVFLGWTSEPAGICSGSDPTCNVDMADARIVRASFGRPDLTVDADFGGSVTGPGIDCPGDCTASFDADEVVSLSADPDSPRFRFEGWAGSCDGFSCTLTMDGNKSVRARFSGPWCGEVLC